MRASSRDPLSTELVAQRIPSHIDVDTTSLPSSRAASLASPHRTRGMSATPSVAVSPKPSPLLRSPMAKSSSSHKRLGGMLSEGVPMLVDGALAHVSLDVSDNGGGGVSWSYELDGCLGCLPAFGQHSESLPLREMIAVEIKPRSVRRQWCSWSEKAWALNIFTFRRAPSNPSYWHPRQITLLSTDEELLRSWHATLHASIRSQAWRPRRLLIIINPAGGSRQAPSIWASTVAPVFRKAGINCTVVETQEPLHATTIVRQLLGGTDMDQMVEQPAPGLPPASGVSSEGVGPDDADGTPTASGHHRTTRPSLDGVIAIGGDGLFHEIVNGVLELRAANSPTVAMGSGFRIGHIPAGSTDAVACTLNGTRSAFTAAVHIVLGDNVPLDVLRLDSQVGRPDFATCMVSYGFMGDLMAESESLRWLGPMRYELVGARMLAANRSYTARVSYLPPPPSTGRASFSSACHSNCEFCIAGLHEVRSHANGYTASAEDIWKAHRDQFVQLPEQAFAGIMLVIMPCRSDKSKKGVAKYGHLSDGLLHLVLIHQCSRLQYLKFLLRMSHIGLEAGGNHGDYIQIVPAKAVRIEVVGKESHWNVDGELIRSRVINAQLHRGVIDVFARGVDG